MNEIVFELIDDVWRVENINKGPKMNITNEQFSDLMNQLQQRRIRNVFFEKDAIENLIVLSDNLMVIIKNYETVKYRQEISEFSKIITTLLLQSMLKNIKNTNEIVFESINDVWHVEAANISPKIDITHKQFAELMDILQEREIRNVFFNKGPLEDLIISYDDLRVTIKNYEKVKSIDEMKNFSRDINKLLLQHVMRVTKKLLNNMKVKVTAISLAAAMIGMGSYNLIKQNQDKTASPNTTTSSNSDSIKDKEFNSINQEESSGTNSDSINQDDSSKTNNNSINQDDSNNINDNKIIQCFDKYCTIFAIKDEIKNKLYRKNVDSLKVGDTIESEIIDIIYSYYETNLYEEAPIKYNNYTNEEQEEYIIKYAMIDGVTDEETIYTMLAVHRLETGYGNSDYCRKYNNLGGIYGTNPNNNEFEIKKYPNIDVAAIDFVNVFTRIMEECKKLPTYSPNNTLEYNINPIYCTEKIDSNGPEWYEVIADLKQDIKSEYQNKIDDAIDTNGKTY